MKIFRGRDGRLYTIELCRPMMYTGEWYEATPLWGGKTKKAVNLNDYRLVSER